MIDGAEEMTVDAGDDTYPVQGVVPVTPPGVLLGLVATTIGSTFLEYLSAPSGQGSTFSNIVGLCLPAAGALILYAALLRLHRASQAAMDSQLLGPIVAFCAAWALRALPMPLDEIAAIATYAAVVHARVVRGSLQARLVALALALGLVPIALPLTSQLTPVAYGIWVAGLLYVYAMADQHMTERLARLHSEGLVRELRLAQGRLRRYAAQAEDTATMRERARLARELHDTLAQGLAAIAMQLDTGDAVFTREPDTARRALRRARDIAREHLDLTRSSVLALRTDVGPATGLADGLGQLVAAWRPWGEPAEGQATFHADPELGQAALPPAPAGTCYRVAREALHNAARHSGARHVAVELSLESGGLCLTVTDDGCGFDPGLVRPRHDGGYGVIGMRERVALLGGQFEVLSAPGAGTQIVATLPLRGVQRDPALAEA